jgi:hypothetical protein
MTVGRPIADAPAISATGFDREHCPVKSWTPDQEHEAWANMNDTQRDEDSIDRVRGGYNEARLYRGFNLLSRGEDERPR